MSVQILQPHYHSEPKERKEPKESDFDKVYKALMLAKTGLGIYSDIDNLKTNYAKREEMDKTNKHNETVRPLEVEAKRLANDSAVAKGYQDTAKANKDFKEAQRLENRQFHDEEILEKYGKLPGITFAEKGGPGITTFKSIQGNEHHVKGLNKEQMAKDKLTNRGKLTPYQEWKVNEHNRKRETPGEKQKELGLSPQLEIKELTKYNSSLEQIRNKLIDFIKTEQDPNVSDVQKRQNFRSAIYNMATSDLGKSHVLRRDEMDKYGGFNKKGNFDIFDTASLIWDNRKEALKQMQLSLQRSESSLNYNHSRIKSLENSEEFVPYNTTFEDKKINLTDIIPHTKTGEPNFSAMTTQQKQKALQELRSKRGP